MTAARGEEFLLSIAHREQDTLVHACVDKKSSVDVDNLDAIIADYFDTTRGDGMTQKAIATWADEVFFMAFHQRQTDQNASGVVAQVTDAQIAARGSDLVKYIKGVTSSTAGTVSKHYVKNLLRYLTGYLELGLFNADDEILQHVTECCESQLAIPEDAIDGTI